MMATSLKTYFVNSFTNQLFKGNPAGVCFPDKHMPDEHMLAIAKELGFSETAFVYRQSEEEHFSIRYFSPKMEIPLCGHATLASSKILFEEYDLEQVRFTTVQNVHLPVGREGQQIIMEFPVYTTEPASTPEALLDALGIQTINECVYNTELRILLIELPDCQSLATLEPDFDALLRSHDSINGVLVTAESKHDEYNFHSRYFWPWSGTNEDPVTGGTHTFLTPYWSERLGKRALKSFQSSARTGFMDVELTDDHTLLIKGEAVIALKGQLYIE